MFHRRVTIMVWLLGDNMLAEGCVFVSGRPPSPLGRSQVVESSGTAWVSNGGVRQGAASRQMPNPAEPRQNQ